MTSKINIFKRPDKNREKDFSAKGSRRGIATLFLATIILSFFFWSRNQFGQWWQKIMKPAVYQIKKTKKEELRDLLGFEPDLTDLEAIEQSIKSLIQDLRGEYGVYFYHLEEKKAFGINEDKVFTAASVNKIPIITAFYQQVEKGKLNEDDTYKLKAEDIQDYGTGSMRYQPIGTAYSYAKLAELSGKESDNTAAYVLLKLSEKAVNDILKKLKMENTSIENNTTTPKEMSLFLQKLYNFELVNEELTEKVFNTMIDTQFEDRIPKGVPNYIKVSHKIGNEIQVINDCGIIFSDKPYILCIFTEGAAEEEALSVIPKISQIIWELAK